MHALSFRPNTLESGLSGRGDHRPLQIYYFGHAHADGDILVHIPAPGVLFVGDVFAPDRLAVLSDPAARPDVPRRLEVLGRVLQNKGELKTVIGGHAMVKDRPWTVAQYRYMRDLWNAVKEAQASGSNPEAVDTAFPLEKKFAYLSPYFDLASKETIVRHKENIQTFWRAGLKSAAAEIEAVLRQSGTDAARARFQEIRTQLADNYYVDEREFNALGYKLDVQGETEEPPKFGPGEQTGLQGPYLGQEPPGLKTRLFAPGVISTASHMEFAITFSPDRKDIFFTRRKEPDGSNTVMVMRLRYQGWTAPEEAAFGQALGGDVGVEGSELEAAGGAALQAKVVVAVSFEALEDGLGGAVEAFGPLERVAPEEDVEGE